MAVTKKKRDKPCKPRGVDSKGINGAKRHPLTVIEKVLADRGLLASLKHVECKNNWRGAASFKEPYDAAQAAANRRLYPHLFHN